MRAIRRAGVALGATLALLAGAGSAGSNVACQTDIAFGVLRAKAACFLQSGSVYTSSGAVRINGVDVTPAGGASVALDTSAGRVTSTSATVSANAGPLGTITLWSGAVNWAVPGGTAPLTLVEFDLGPLASLAGIQLRGEVSLVLTGPGTAEIPVYASLPDPLGVSGNLLLKFDMDRGLYLDSLRIDLKEAYIGSLRIENAFFTYAAANNEFTGGGKLSFPSAGSLEIALVIANARLRTLHADYNAPPPGLALGGSVYFRRAVFDYRYQDAPTTVPRIGRVPAGPVLSGAVTLTGGGEVGGKPLSQVRGTLTYWAGQPWRLAATGDLTLSGIPAASAYFNYVSTGQFSFGGNAKGTLFGLVKVEGTIDVWYEDRSHWSGEGKVTVCVWRACGVGQAVISNVGIAGCIHTWLGDFGAGARWGTSPTFYLSGCSIGLYRGTRRALASVKHPEVLASREIVISEDMPFAVFRAQGRGRVPKVIVAGPGGRRIEGTADPGAYVSNREAGYIVWNIGPEDASYVIVEDPAPGTWTVDAAHDSVELVDADLAEGYEPPQVKAKVVRAGKRWLLRYETDLPEGAHVRFEEQGPRVWNDLRVIPGDREGEFRFVPADGPGGKRTIFALVSRDGIPDARFAVASYVAPKPPPPGKPSFVRVSRDEGNIVIEWGDAPRAQRYAVYVLFGNGVRHELDEPKSAKRVVIDDADDESSVLATVIALDDDGDRGKPVRSSLPGRGG
jgi:hypothetical protein